MGRMPAVRLAHTSELEVATLAAIERMVVGAFPGNFDEHDWEHALGGIHAIVEEDGSIVAHGAVVQRRLLHAGRALRTGYVEAVAVRPDRQRRGLGTAVINALTPVIRGAYAIGALAASEQAGRLYSSLGWVRWLGATWVLSPNGIERTADEDGGIYVLPLDTSLDLTGDLVCDWRDGDVW
jgi:aminoglycoside 2'-N-acetyltransferase I